MIFQRIRENGKFFWALVISLGWAALPLTSTRAPAAITASIEINETVSGADDYICWGPVAARIRLTAPAAAPVAMTLTSEAAPGGGAVRFIADTGAKPKPSNFNPLPELTVSVPGDGSWQRFWIVGWRASNGAKDIRVVAKAAGQQAAQVDVMVRVRKDAETLSDAEVRKFLQAIATVHNLSNGGLNSQWTKHVRAHEEAFQFGIHGTPLFAAWHRAFLLGIERELQAIDPTVALPYWRFDRSAPKLFTREFIGVVSSASSPGGFLVEFDPQNPLLNWEMFDGRGALVRVRNAGQQAALPSSNWNTVQGDPVYEDFNDDLEFRYHNGAHSYILGWLGTASSPRDPLFYLLHANVDRGWAHWQARHNRFDPDGTDANSYAAPGAYPASGGAQYRKGVYAKDRMWPWSGSGGNQGTPDPGDDWPNFTYPMMAAAPGIGPVLPPQPQGQVDYLDTAGRGLAHAACYDDIDFVGKNPLTDHN